MKEIKFRAWHKANKKYYKVSCIEFDNKCVFLEGVDSDDKIDLGFSFDEVIIEQYTGLKEMNGKEIYEGDILNFYDRYEGKIVYSTGSFIFEEASGRQTPVCTFSLIDYIIVGNIHEREGE